MITLIPNEQKNFTNGDEFKAFIKAKEKENHEETIEFKDWSVVEEGLKIKNKVHPMRRSGMETLLDIFHMPRQFYFNKAPTDMVIRDINRMRDEYESESTMDVMLQKDEIRAVVPVSRHTAHSKILKTLEKTKNSFMSASYDDLNARILFNAIDEKPITISKNDIVNVGMDIVHSDIGRVPLSGSPFLLRLICTNGMVAKEKSQFLQAFTQKFLESTDETKYLELLEVNAEKVNIDSQIVRSAFKVMKTKVISDLPNGLEHMKKIRGAVGYQKFDQNEKLSVRFLEEGKEKTAINTDCDLFTVIDLVTREAKVHPFMNRRRIELLSGTLMVMVVNEFVKAETN